MIRLPVLDEQLDRFAIVQTLVEHAPREGGEFGVTGKPQRDKLIDRELGNPRRQVRREALAHA